MEPDAEMAGMEAIKDSLVEGGVKPEKAAEKYSPSYKMMEDTKIPVSKQMGKLWKSRRDQAKAKLKNEGIADAWDECIRYYNNDQVTHSNISDSPNVSRMSRKGTGISDEHIETERPVFEIINIRPHPLPISNSWWISPRRPLTCAQPVMPGRMNLRIM